MQCNCVRVWFWAQRSSGPWLLFLCASSLVGGMLFGVSGLVLLFIIIIIKRRSGINPIPPTVIDRG